MSLSKARPVKADEVRAWKLFYAQPDGSLISWLGPERYETGKTYEAEWSPSAERWPQESPWEAPGFHGFVQAADAFEYVEPAEHLFAYRVALSVGLREGESMTAGGGRAYSGQRMRVVPRG